MVEFVSTTHSHETTLEDEMDIEELEYISIVAQAMFWVVAAIGAATVFAMWILPHAFPWH